MTCQLAAQCAARKFVHERTAQLYNTFHDTPLHFKFKKWQRNYFANQGFLVEWGLCAYVIVYAILSPSQSLCYCNRTNFHTRFNFVYFVLLAGSMKFRSIRKLYMYTSVSDTTVAVRKFLAYKSRQIPEYGFFRVRKFLRLQ